MFPFFLQIARRSTCPGGRRPKHLLGSALTGRWHWHWQMQQCCHPPVRCTPKRACLHTCAHARARAHTHAHTHTSTRPPTHTRARARTHAPTRPPTLPPRHPAAQQARQDASPAVTRLPCATAAPATLLTGNPCDAYSSPNRAQGLGLGASPLKVAPGPTAPAAMHQCAGAGQEPVSAAHPRLSSCPHKPSLVQHGRHINNPV